MEDMARNTRNFKKLRHWKQRWSKDSKFIWRRGTTYGCKRYEPGDDIPKELEENKTKLRRFWEAQMIELAEFDAPNVATGQVDDPKGSPEVPKGVTVMPGKGSWSIVTTVDGKEHKVNGKRALEALLVDLKEKAGKDDDGKDDDGKDDADGAATEGIAKEDAWLDGGKS